MHALAGRREAETKAALRTAAGRGKSARGVESDLGDISKSLGVSRRHRMQELLAAARKNEKDRKWISKPL